MVAASGSPEGLLATLNGTVANVALDPAYVLASVGGVSHTTTSSPTQQGTSSPPPRPLSCDDTRRAVGVLLRPVSDQTVAPLGETHRVDAAPKSGSEEAAHRASVTQPGPARAAVSGWPLTRTRAAGTGLWSLVS